MKYRMEGKEEKKKEKKKNCHPRKLPPPPQQHHEPERGKPPPLPSVASLLHGVPLDVLPDHVLREILELPDQPAIHEEQQRGNVEHISHVLYRGVRLNRVARKDDGARPEARRARRRGDVPVQAAEDYQSFFSSSSFPIVPILGILIRDPLHARHG